MLNTNSPLAESDIRPDDLVAKQKQYIEIDIKRLLSRKNEFVRVSCVACGGNRLSQAFLKFELSYMKCANCNTVYITPRPTPEILCDFYTNSENYKFWNNHIFPATESNRRERIFRPRAHRLLEICERYHVERGTMLEIGAGYGTFCQEVANLNYFERIIAVEPTPDLAKTCKSRGINVLDVPIENVSLVDSSIDVIVSFEVIEHLFSPFDFVSHCFRILKKDGIIVVSCPNIDGFDIMLLGEKATAIDHEHLNYFNPSSLSILFERAGFNVIEILTPGKLDAELVRKAVLRNEYDISGQQFWEKIFIEDWERIGNAFQDFLANNLLSSHMWLVAKK